MLLKWYIYIYICMYVCMYVYHNQLIDLNIYKNMGKKNVTISLNYYISLKL